MFSLEQATPKNSANICSETWLITNQRYGEFTLSSARLLNRSDMPNVIAPAWKPNGHRRTV